jgi:hypothetical protein
VESESDKENEATQVNIHLPTRAITTNHNSDHKPDSDSHSHVGSTVKFAISGTDLIKSGADSP